MLPRKAVLWGFALVRGTCTPYRRTENIYEQDRMRYNNINKIYKKENAKEARNFLLFYFNLFNLQ